MSRIINLPQTKTIIIVEEQKYDSNIISVDSVTDDGQSVVANISFGVSGTSKTFTLWFGDAYTAIGQWTDENVNARILELI